jgi:hypothetical protein
VPVPPTTLPAAALPGTLQRKLSSGAGAAPAWLIFAYRVPSEPSSRRVLVWRRLRRLAALPLHDGAYLLPRTPRTLEQLQWLQAEVEEMGGEASLWEASPVPPGRSARFAELFNRQFEAGYARVAAVAAGVRARLQSAGGDDPDTLLACERDYQAASREYLALRSQDHLGSEAGAAARRALETASAALRDALERPQGPGEPPGRAAP